MKQTVGWLMLMLLLVPWLWAQDAQQSGQEGQPSAADQQEDRPTLGRAPGSDTHGPQTATVNDYQKLVRMQRIFVERMDNALSEKLVVALGKIGRFKLVASPKDADAILHGSCLESRRLKHVHSEVFISDRAGKSIWQDNIMRPYNPPTLDQAVSATASTVVEHLGESLHQAATR
jgi:hypothetical protein